MNREIPHITFTKGDLVALENAANTFYRLESNLVSKVSDVFAAIMFAFRIEGDFRWWFNNAEEGSVGHCDLTYEVISDYEIRPQYELKTSAFDYSCEFPKEYLFMSRQEIVDEILEQLAADAAKKAEREKRQASLKAKSNAKKSAALAKLSDEDKRVLGLS